MPRPIGGGQLGARAQAPGLAMPVFQQEVRADSVQPGERAAARTVEGLAPLERDPEQLADQPLGDPGPDPAAQEAQQRGRMAVVDRPEGLGLVQRAADHLGVRRSAHRLFFPGPRPVVRGSYRRPDRRQRPRNVLTISADCPSMSTVTPMAGTPLAGIMK
jgi:hypothetical protein